MTEKVGDSEYQSLSVIDSWSLLVDTFSFLYFLSGLILFDYPDSVYFGAPTQSTNESPFKGTGLPYFATSNSTYYEELDSNFNASSYALDLGLEESVATGSSNFDSDTNTFTQSLDARVSDTNTTSSGASVSLNIVFKFDVAVDVSRSLVTKFFVEYKFELVSGSASSLTHYRIGMTEGSGGSSSLPGPSLWLAFGSLFVVSILLRRRK